MSICRWPSVIICVWCCWTIWQGWTGLQRTLPVACHWWCCSLWLFRQCYSAYPFENKLKEIKRLVRKPTLPLQQVARRLIEPSQRRPTDVTVGVNKPACHSFHVEHSEGPVADDVSFTKQYRKLSVKGVLLSVNEQGRCVQLVDKLVAVIEKLHACKCYQLSLICRHLLFIIKSQWQF